MMRDLMKEHFPEITIWFFSWIQQNSAK